MSLPQQEDPKLISSINVTPLVDITLVLLIVFMVTAKFIVSQSMALELPEAASTKSVQLVLGVEVKQDGDTLVNGTPVTDDGAILTRAREALRENPQLRAVIQADRRVAHGRVIRVLDLLRQAGITKVAFSVTPRPPEAERELASVQSRPTDRRSATSSRLARAAAP